jgi:hypothetical protein
MALPLLSGLTAAVRAAPGDAEVEQSAAACLIALVDLLHRESTRPQRTRGGIRALQHVAAAVELADLLLAGGGGSRAAGRGACSCGVHDASSSTFCGRLAGSRSAGSRCPFDASDFDWLLRQLTELQASVAEEVPDQLMLVSKGGLQLMLRGAALHMAALRRQQGGRAVPAAGADLALFLGGWDAAVVVPRATSANRGLAVPVSQISLFLEGVVDAPGAVACPRCLPQQLLLVMEAAAHSDEIGMNVCGLHNLIRNFQEPWRPWLPAFMGPAVRLAPPMLAAAAAELQAGPPAVTRAGRPMRSLPDLGDGWPNDTDIWTSVRAGMARSLLCIVLLMPGGLVEAPEQHAGAPLEQLLGSCEVVVRALGRVAGPGFGMVIDPGAKMDLAVGLLKVGGVGGLSLH